MPNAEEWGKGYDFGQMGMMKAIKTAEELATYRERDRIIKLLSEQPNGIWRKYFLQQVIDLINGVNE